MTTAKFCVQAQHITQHCQRSCVLRSFLKAGTFFALAACLSVGAHAESIHHITVDGNFSDWASLPTYTDRDAAPGVLHNGIPDTHHTDASSLGSVPGYREHPDVDILEYKFTHDENNLYAFFEADGVIGRTQEASEGRTRFARPSYRSCFAVCLSPGFSPGRRLAVTRPRRRHTASP